MFDIVKNIFIINLRDDLGRYNHCLYELSKINHQRAHFITAVRYDDDIVKDYYINNKVKNFDSCFRCDDINVNT